MEDNKESLGTSSSGEVSINENKDIKNKGKLYRMLGLFSGLAFVVLFI